MGNILCWPGHRVALGHPRAKAAVAELAGGGHCLPSPASPRTVRCQGSVPSISPHFPCPQHQCKACTGPDIDPSMSPSCYYLLIGSLLELPLHTHGFVPSALALFRYEMISAGSLPCLQTGSNPNCFP